MNARTPGSDAFDGAVLTGGLSSRMGHDKSLLTVEGIAMATRVASALRAAGARQVVSIGGDEARLAALGEHPVADRFPGDGPLGGVITALATAAQPIVVITACDMPWVEPVHVEPLVAALLDAPELDLAISAANGDLQPLHAAWRVRSLGEVQRFFDGGGRAPRRVVSVLRHVVIELGGGRWSTDLDTPEDYTST